MSLPLEQAGAAARPLTVPEDLFLAIGARRPVGALNIPHAWRLRGPLDREAIAAALAELPRRHDILRTGYRRGEDGSWEAAVEPEAEPIRLEEDPDLERAAARPFDISRPPLCRVVLAATGGDEHVLLIVAHHLIADAAGLWALVADLAAEYRRARDPGTPQRPLPHQYSEYAAWDAGRMTEEFLAEATEYWTRKLAGCRFASLPRNQGGESAPDAYECVGASLGASPAAAVRALGEAEGASDYMVLLTTFALTMCELTGANDLASPSVFTTRVGPRFGEVVGAMVTAVAIRAEVEPGDPRASLRAVRDSCLEALRYYHVPRSVAQAALLRSSRGIVRSGGASVRFQVMPAPPVPVWDGLEVAAEESLARTFGADAEISIVDWPAEPVVEVAYRTDRVDAEVAGRLLEAFVRNAQTVGEGRWTASG